MKIKFPFTFNNKAASLSSLEARLDSALRPLQPREEFVQQLRNQLVGVPDRHKIALSPEKMRNGLLIAGAAVSALVVVAAGVRATITFLGALGVIQQVKKQANEASPLPARVR